MRLTNRLRTLLAALMGLLVTTAGHATTGASLYEHCNYQGRVWHVSIGNFSTQSLADMGIDIRQVSSIAIEAGTLLLLFEGQRFDGRKMELRNNDDCLVDNGFNDSIGSIRVLERPVAGPNVAPAVPPDVRQVVAQCPPGTQAVGRRGCWANTRTSGQIQSAPQCPDGYDFDGVATCKARAYLLSVPAECPRGYHNDGRACAPNDVGQAALHVLDPSAWKEKGCSMAACRVDYRRAGCQCQLVVTTLDRSNLRCPSDSWLGDDNGRAVCAKCPAGMTALGTGCVEQRFVQEPTCPPGFQRDGVVCNRVAR